VRRPRLPRTKRGLAALLGGAVVVIAAGAFAFVYFVLFPTSSPKPFSLGARNAAPTGSAAAIAGRWTIARGSRAGYRVREKLAFLPAMSDAVGRTSAITGAATFTAHAGTLVVTSASFTIDVSTLKSDEAQRDEHIATIGIQSATYPRASFVLSRPLRLPAGALDGRVFADGVTGVLTMHGTARRLAIPIRMRLSRTRIQAVGSLTFPWGLFNMTAPSVGGFVSVTGRATMEFALTLKRT
jgi:polyisoprenoid-binding protein YceI